MKSARVKRSNSPELAQESTMLSTKGIIRPGIKMLTKKAIAGIPGAQQLYDEGVAAGVSFDDIELRLKQKNKDIPYPMRPANVPYFVVRQGDFESPEAAFQLLSLYGEDRGDGNGRQLHRFPVSFITNEDDLNFPEYFEGYEGHRRVRWSAMGADGELKCMNRREKTSEREFNRVSGEIVRDCDPNTCDFFRSEKKLCTHRGTLVFVVPGAEYGLFKLSTGSECAPTQIVEELKMVRDVLGRVSGTIFLAGEEKPIFWLSKKQVTVTPYDAREKKEVSKKQWVITLTADTYLLFKYLREKALSTKAIGEDRAKQEALEAPKPDPEPTADDEVKDLRRALGQVLNSFDPPWGGDDLMEWLEGNSMDKASVHDAAQLAEIIRMLSSAQQQTKDELEPAQQDRGGILE